MAPAQHRRPQNQPDEPGADQGLGLSVLIIEDETMIALVLSDLLRELGCHIVGWGVTAEDAERLAAMSRPDLVIMDYALKGREDGMSAARRVIKMHDVPVLFITGLQRTDVLERLADFPRAALLLKPFTAGMLREAVVEATGK